MSARGDACTPPCYSLRGQGCWTTTSSGLCRPACCTLGIGLSAFFKQLGESENDLLNLRVAAGRCSQLNLSQQHHAESNHFIFLIYNHKHLTQAASLSRGQEVKNSSKVEYKTNLLPFDTFTSHLIVSKYWLSFVIFGFLFFANEFLVFFINVNFQHLRTGSPIRNVALWTDRTPFPWGSKRGKKNLHPISPASICASSENVIPVVKLDGEVSGSSPYCACALTYGSAFFYSLMWEEAAHKGAAFLWSITFRNVDNESIKFCISDCDAEEGTFTLVIHLKKHSAKGL